MDLNEIKHVTVIGAGVMGHSLAQVFAQKGYRVQLCDIDKSILDRAMQSIRLALESLVEFNILAKEEIRPTLNRIETSTQISGPLNKADFVIEAVPELPEVKKAVFNDINEHCSKESILASNTSGLDIFNIVEVDNLERLIITHWFSPPHIIPLVEIVPGEKTSPGVIAVTKKVMESLDKKPVVLKKFVPAFIVNRIQNAINKALFEIIDSDWADPEDIDLAVKATLGIRLPIVGIAQSLDFAGLDLIKSINERLGVDSKFLDKKVKAGHLGAKTSKGIFDYRELNEDSILKKRDRKYLGVLKYLNQINAFEPL